MKGQLMGYQDLKDERILYFISAEEVSEFEIGACLNVICREVKNDTYSK